jgi:hypothetical protein
MRAACARLCAAAAVPRRAAVSSHRAAAAQADAGTRGLSLGLLRTTVIPRQLAAGIPHPPPLSPPSPPSPSPSRSHVAAPALFAAALALRLACARCASTAASATSQLRPVAHDCASSTAQSHAAQRFALRIAALTSQHTRSVPPRCTAGGSCAFRHSCARRVEEGALEWWCSRTAHARTGAFACRAAFAQRRCAQRSLLRQLDSPH